MASNYPRLQAEVHAAVRRNVPRGRTVLVVSRGDEQFVRLEGHRGWHFPRHEDGRWGGYHPADSEAAIAHLEELRSKGAQYLVFPETALWWLDHYADLREHLESRYRLLDQSESCLIYDITRRAARPGGDAIGAEETGRASERRYAALIDEVRRVAAEMLPVGSTVLVASDGDDALLTLGNVQAWHFPRHDDGSHEPDYPEDEAAIAHLEKLRSKGAQYIVFPETSFWWLESDSPFELHLRKHYSTVYSDGTCRVLDLVGQPVSGVVDRLLPADARIAVVSVGMDITELEKLESQGIEFVVVPHSAFAWLDRRPSFRRHLLEHHHLVTRQQNLCEIYELSGDA
jgi:hypothetical protein